MKDDECLAQFIETLCTTCRACSNLISLSPDTENCEKCLNSSKKRARADSVSPIVPEKRQKTCQVNSNNNSSSNSSTKSEKVNIKLQTTSPSSTTCNNKSASTTAANADDKNSKNTTKSLQSSPGSTGSGTKMIYKTIKKELLNHDESNSPRSRSSSSSSCSESAKSNTANVSTTLDSVTKVENDSITNSSNVVHVSIELNLKLKVFTN